jgi:methylglutaconyl-CoA hydratase
MPELILTQAVQAGISLVTLNRPDRRNALSIELMRQLCDAIDRLAADPAQRVAILRGEGPAFCAGLDLHEAADFEQAAESGRLVERTLRTLRETPLITICAAHGSALAGGAGLMAACDIVVAADDLWIGFPEVRRGLLPALITRVLMHKVRDGDLRDLFLVAEPIDARRALQIGLVQRVVPAEKALIEATSLARCVLKGGPQAVRGTKLMLNELRQVPPGDLTAHLLKMHHVARESDEAREGLLAFIKKRATRWTSE